MSTFSKFFTMFSTLMITFFVLTTGCKKEDEPEVTTVEDIDGNSYPFVVIGTQTWMAENLKTTKLNNGTAVSNESDNNAWSNTENPAYCWYNNDINNKDKYGALYNFHAVTSGKLCPSGWHIPSDEEWMILENFLGGTSTAGGKMKEVGTAYWNEPNAGATNSSKFSARGGGVRFQNGAFHDRKSFGLWWTSSSGGTGSWFKSINSQTALLNTQSYGINNGLSVRCIKSE